MISFYTNQLYDLMTDDDADKEMNLLKSLKNASKHNKEMYAKAKKQSDWGMNKLHFQNLMNNPKAGSHPLVIKSN